MNSRRIIVVGGGPGGYVAAIRASQLGAKVLLIEKDRIGGTCLNRGCIPTKALLHDAMILRRLKESPVFGLYLEERLDLLSAMMERKAKVVDEMVKGIEILLESHRVSVRQGEGELLGGKRIGFLGRDGQKEDLQADAIILSPGSKSRSVAPLKPDKERIITSDEALELRTLPREMVIVGGGYIGAELATLFRSLGSKVTLIEILEEILPGLDSEIVRNLKRVFEKDGIRILTGSSVEEIQEEGETLRLTVKTPQGTDVVGTSKVLVAIGREPRLDLDFGKAGVEVSPSGIRVNARMETSASGIYAVGDAVGGPLLAYVASEEAVVAAENAMGIEARKKEAPIPLCVFTHPEIASIGLTEQEAKSQGEIRIGRFPFRSNPKALIAGEREGLIKVISRRESGEILGIHMIGSGAGELLCAASLIINQKVRTKEFSEFLQVHPTLSEALREAVLDTEGQAIHLPRPLRKK